MTTSDAVAVVPEMAMAVLAMILVVMAPLARRRPLRVYVTAIAGFIVLGIVIGYQSGSATGAFSGTFRIDVPGTFLKELFLAVGVISLLSLFDNLRDVPRIAESPAFIAFGTLGAMLLVSAENIVLVAVGFAILTAASYALVGINVRLEKSQEAALKLFTFAAVSGSLMLFGFSFFYGMTGQFDFPMMHSRLAHAPFMMLAYATMLVFVGYAFEAAVFPMSEWVPDVYEGAPTAVALWMSLTPKLAALMLLLRTFIQVFPQPSIFWSSALAIIAALTMTWANIAAYAQTDVKRMLAYSSIAHAGVILAAISVAGTTPVGIESFLYYAAGYTVMNAAAFAVLAVIEKRTGLTTFVALAGLGKTAPWVAVAMTIALLSLAGFPPFVGFGIKVAVMRAVFAGHAQWLGIVIALNALLALGYYIRPITVIYRGTETSCTKERLHLASIACFITVMATILFGIYPSISAPTVP